jgi:hypothetical protein
VREKFVFGASGICNFVMRIGGFSIHESGVGYLNPDYVSGFVMKGLITIGDHSGSHRKAALFRFFRSTSACIGQEFSLIPGISLHG